MRLSSVDEASSFFEKVQLLSSWPICLYSSSFSVSACWRICSRPLPKISGNPASACFFHPPRLGRMDPEHLCDLGSSPMRLDGFHGDFRLQAGWVTLAGFLGIDSSPFSMPHST